MKYPSNRTVTSKGPLITSALLISATQSQYTLHITQYNLYITHYTLGRYTLRITHNPFNTHYTLTR